MKFKTLNVEKILNGTYDLPNRIIIGVGGLVCGIGFLTYALETSLNGDKDKAIIAGICGLMASGLTLYKKY